MTSDTKTPDTAADDQDAPKRFPCPRCGALTAWQNNAAKPFCSPRCKLIDLGAWANEEYSVPAESSPFSDEL